MELFFDINESAAAFSPLVGEMSPRATEGVAKATLDGFLASRAAEITPPGGFAATLPARGREGAAFAIMAEMPADVATREALLDRAMGPGRKRKSSEKLRRGRKPSEGLAFVARDEDGRVVGTVRLWDVAFVVDAIASSTVFATPSGAGACPRADRRPDPGGATSPARGEEGRALLLGPLAVDPSVKSAGIGSALMRQAIAEAKRLGHRAILLVGDAPYYARFGFSAEKTGALAMPGPYERHRFLALELADGALDGAHGVLRAAGRKTGERIMKVAAAA